MSNVLSCAEESEWKKTLPSLVSGSVPSKLLLLKKQKQKPQKKKRKVKTLGSLGPEGGDCYGSHEGGHKQK